LEDGMISSMEDCLARHMTVIERPAANERVEVANQLACGEVAAFLDTDSDLSEERLDALLRRSNEELGAFSPAVFPYRLSKASRTPFRYG
jgi:hypothetical protein